MTFFWSSAPPDCERARVWICSADDVLLPAAVNSMVPVGDSFTTEQLQYPFFAQGLLADFAADERGRVGVEAHPSHDEPSLTRLGLRQQFLQTLDVGSDGPDVLQLEKILAAEPPSMIEQEAISGIERTFEAAAQPDEFFPYLMKSVTEKVLEEPDVARFA